MIAGIRKKRVLLVCSPRMQSVGAGRRMLNEMEFLQSDLSIKLGVVVWAMADAAADEKERVWIKEMVSKWPWAYWIIYPTPMVGLGKLGKMTSKVLRALLFLKVLAIWNPDVVHAHQSLASKLYVFKYLFGFRLVADIHGASPEEFTYSGGTKDLLRSVEVDEAKTVVKSDSIICVSNKMVDHLEKKYNVAAAKFVVIPCCIHGKEIDFDRTNRNAIREQMGFMDKIIMVYGGGSGSYQCVKQMCRLFFEVVNNLADVVWLILTWGSTKEFIIELNRLKIPLDRYRILQLPQKDVRDYLTASDVALVIREDLILNRVSCPTKIGEYLGCGLPLIVTPYVGDIPGWVLENKLGIVSELRTNDDMKRINKFLRSLQEEDDHYSNRCILFAKSNLTWERYLKSFHKAYGL